MSYIVQHIDLILFSVYANLCSEAKRFYISYLWWIINPIIDMFAFYIVFKFLLNRGVEDFVPFLLIGIVSWRWMSITVIRSANSLLVNSFLINQVFIPKILLPTIIVLTESVKFFISFIILLFFLFLYGFSPTQYYFALILLLFTELMLIISISYFFAAVTPFFPDIQIILQNGIQLFFFLSGIFYSIDSFSSEYQFWFYLNPMAKLIQGFRAVFLSNQWPDFKAIALIAILSLILIYTSSLIMDKYEKKYPRIVMS